jgi:hypothetical protein
MDANKLRISRNVIFLKNEYFFSSHPNYLSSSILFPSFNNLSSTLSCFNPSIVYYLCCPLPFISSKPPPDLVMYVFRQSTKVS